MGMVLTEGEISTFQECVRRDLLTYVSYPSFKGATRCFAYPQFLVEDETLTLLEDSAFPDNGCLPMVTSRTTPHELLGMFGNVVVMRVNDEHPGRNRNYPESEASRFNSIIDPYFAKGASSVEFMPLSRHSLSGSLVQVLDIQEIIDLTHAQAQPVHVRSVASLPQTKLVVVSQGKLGARKYYGPFEATCVEGLPFSCRQAILMIYVSAFSMRVNSIFPLILLTIWATWLLNISAQKSLMPT